MRMLYKLLLSFTLVLTGCASGSKFSAADIEYFQPQIVSQTAPERPLNSYSVYNNTVKVGLSPMQPVVPSYNGKGNLLASWNPHPAGVKNRPTFVFVHGGHGLGTNDFASAVWARKELGANTLVLDSYWSRGREENWQTYNSFGANMRMLDAIAAGRWLHEQGVDKDKVFIMGGSQGGWTVMRTFTDDPWINEQAKGLYRGGVALYPVCNSKGFRDDPTLAPYTTPMLVFTAGDDSATPPSRCPSNVFEQSAGWTHYPTATHGFDTANRGSHTPAVDGECGKAANVYNRFKVCRSDSATFDMQDKVKKFVRNLINGNNEFAVPAR
jgi:dienelactone hydrolase